MKENYFIAIYAGASFKKNIFKAVFNVKTITQNENILGSSFNLSQVNKMLIDGEIVTPKKTHKFSSMGQHVVEYEMNNSFNDCSNMFENCWNLISLDFSEFNTSKVTNMYRMFAQCQNLASLDLSSFDTKNVTNMSWMFYACQVIENLDLSSFDTRNVTDMSNMFSLCHALETVDVSSFDTRNVTNMSYMFPCKKLKSINLSSFDTRNVTDVSNMFLFYSGELLDLSPLNFSSVNEFDDVISSANFMNFIPFTGWKKGDLPLNSTAAITPLAIHQLVEKSITLENGASQRTLYLKDTDKTNWENSEYYTNDSAIMNQCGITVSIYMP